MNKYSAFAQTQEIKPPDNDLAAQAFLHTSQAGAWVPFQQSAITGLLTGVLALALALKFRWHDWWFWPIIVIIVVTLGVWVLLQKHWYRLTMIKLEGLTGIDLNGNGVVEKPKAHRVTVDISEDKGQGGFRRQTANFDVPPETMALLAKSLLAGRPFTEKEWSGPGKPFSLDEFRAMRSEMLKRGIIEKINPKDARQGFKLTLVGRRVMEKLQYAQGPSPTPPFDDVQNE